MGNNFIKIAWRQITRNKVYAAINIIGLAIGIACGLVIYKIISYESGFDKYHKNYSNIYRLISQLEPPGEGIIYAESQVHPIGEAIRNDFPGVDAVMTFYAEKGQIAIENSNGTFERYQENTGLAYAEPEIFEIFDFDFLTGNPQNALSNAGSVVITSSLAQKYFNLTPGNVSNALGKSLSVNNQKTFTVTAVIADTPQNTDLPFTIIADYKSQSASNPYFNDGTDWQEYNSATNCYLLLPGDISPVVFENRLKAFAAKYIGTDSPVFKKYVLQPLSELHSGRAQNYGHRKVSEKAYYILGLVGLFIILLASINFINLSTAQSSKRFKEIGVRKITGVSKFQLISQFMGETILISYIAAFIGVAIAHFLFIYLDEILGYRLSLDILKSPGSIIFLTISALLIGIISGIYPSTIMAGMRPVGNLKNSLPVKNSSNSISVRRILVIGQFVISLVLITGTLVMQKQIHYFLNADLGFDKEAVLIAPLPDATPSKLDVLRSNLLKYPEIKKISFESTSPMADWSVSNSINYPTLDKDLYMGNLKTIDENYLDLYNLKLIAGKNVSERKNSGEAIVNRKITELLGFVDPNNAIGEIFTYGRANREFNIVGVVEDFHAQSLQQQLDYVILSNVSFNIKEVAVKINPVTASLAGYNNSIQKIKKEWGDIFPEAIFNYNFLDKKIAGFYNSQTNTFKLIRLFAVIALLIASLGLYGLISFIANQKIKEIGIRKVNGANIAEVMAMLNINFIKWIAVAFVISTPVAWYAMNKWLENFAYKTSLSWWIFALAGVLALGIALLTVSWQSWRAATRNPVEALRYE
ncbi:FtsX-like permease family protein [Maribellus comscasis]|uniref:FtsX-like permease family protein n=1 Tax=Maribellus comscasis TaxID=2681766 RepID=A0A6I6JNX0_9BACT|nr:ABC transporter permease [Maribellus comscasis]QGY44666.1 FtsX-like permease family protein [Maribellus comscasis]